MATISGQWPGAGWRSWRYVFEIQQRWLLMAELAWTDFVVIWIWRRACDTWYLKTKFVTWSAFDTDIDGHGWFIWPTTSFSFTFDISQFVARSMWYKFSDWLFLHACIFAMHMILARYSPGIPIRHWIFSSMCSTFKKQQVQNWRRHISHILSHEKFGNSNNHLL